MNICKVVTVTSRGAVNHLIRFAGAPLVGPVQEAWNRPEHRARRKSSDNSFHVAFEFCGAEPPAPGHVIATNDTGNEIGRGEVGQFRNLILEHLSSSRAAN